ncbi:sulfatase-like hydrolase/transferase [Paraglaciecola aquimarina]|uniref:Sulfatase-like hydrolase/transferase n=1 Tax=Paraglaciecola aquimarina TaxID=1235557 RepID=A0ABU3SXK7_9ALTE|nr:sulfatase-like hydrolase/transferase [Paraglaciecola aquimarina]MDU0354749.1 sulfatase-like hydrolase/transferase [Paraglaciecola aquimarina]
MSRQNTTLIKLFWHRYCKVVIFPAGLLMLSSCSLSMSGATANKNASVSSANRPNILFIMSDDHAYQAISAYGSKLIDTPNIDRLAKQGMRFTNATVTNSICAPSRATILTGKHTHINGKIDNRMPFDDSQQTFPQIFQRNGYQTAMFGKLHFGNNPKGVDDFMILPDQGDYINPDFETPNGTIRKQGYVTDIITDETLKWLKAGRDQSKPFMLAYLHKAPHRSWWPRADKFAEFYGKQYPLPDSLFDDYASRGTAAKTAEMTIRKFMLPVKDTKVSADRYDPRYEPYVNQKDNIGVFERQYTDRATAQQKIEYEKVLSQIAQDYNDNWPTMSEKEKTIWKYQRYMQDYLATISSVDDNIGRVLDYLDESGLAENTLVVYTSDQGFFLGEHGWYDKRFAYYGINENAFTGALAGKNQGQSSIRRARSKFRLCSDIFRCGGYNTTRRYARTELFTFVNWSGTKVAT